MDYKELFSKTPPTRLFLRAALPGCAGMLASALYQLIDGIFVGRILGDTAFAAPGHAFCDYQLCAGGSHWRRFRSADFRTSG